MSRADAVLARMAAEGGTAQLAADLRARLRALRLTFGPYWPQYADLADVMTVQSLANVLGVPDPTEPTIDAPHY